MSDEAQRVKCPSCGQVTGFHDIREEDLIECIRCDFEMSVSENLVVPKRNPVRVLNDDLNEYRTKHTKLTKDEFNECGAYDAFMWAWQRAREHYENN